MENNTTDNSHDNSPNNKQRWKWTIVNDDTWSHMVQNKRERERERERERDKNVVVIISLIILYLHVLLIPIHVYGTKASNHNTNSDIYTSSSLSSWCACKKNIVHVGFFFVTGN